MRDLSLTVLFGVLALASAATQAHHSFAAEFDSEQPVVITGIVTKVEWRNPHTFFYVDVEGERGKIQNWAMELASPNALTRRGWNRDSLKIGDVVTVEGSRARDGTLKGAASAVVLASGKRLFSTAEAAN